ncbi:hypothetical protein H6G54_28125 [Anabaena cylindrica FACHB-243]|uniref:Uncharacterized protein n=1 Tax=Anabaena cylindrica (strain ATCC 27899 / PCC 7122) TaxID=272123 RepID=K9ZEL8_ANACC|nr:MULTISPECIES: hypothetical protein [Anabaena]AFZ57052.1 hypothetical protein Anacy_1546 [Anabaena cylindrica PCC 7122]MBD2421476.1 hypothetical protein [Anabaena cylindrica FACHB-243]MBY5284667.1 hypothetical protein [Anabaena sp. CCAP 1446/1C]MBY5311408.1 hypothetical protein [Anabaena sp. CCAP 1446/1C]MCM2407763.1 hypothetical protein [Anabaena sp. CCAP 1446/1C]
MKPNHHLTSACRYCRHYQPEGRRGGMCQKLGAPVQSTWKACHLALPAFAPPWETLEDSWSLPVAKPVLPVAQTLNSDLEVPALAPVEEIPVSSPQEVKTTAILI